MTYFFNHDPYISIWDGMQVLCHEWQMSANEVAKFLVYAPQKITSTIDGYSLGTHEFSGPSLYCEANDPEGHAVFDAILTSFLKPKLTIIEYRRACAFGWAIRDLVGYCADAASKPVDRTIFLSAVEPLTQEIIEPTFKPLETFTAERDLLAAWHRQGYTTQAENDAEQPTLHKSIEALPPSFEFVSFTLINQHRQRSQEFDALLKTLKAHQKDFKQRPLPPSIQKRVAATFREYAGLKENSRRPDEAARILKPDEVTLHLTHNLSA